MKTPIKFSKEDVLDVLATVKDPEIDTVSIIDLGMVENITIDNETVNVEILPTFVGCPALELIRINIVKAVNELEGVEETTVSFINSPPWTSDRITEKGKHGLKGIRDFPSAQTYDRRRFLACGLSLLWLYICYNRKYFWSDGMSKHSYIVKAVKTHLKR